MLLKKKITIALVLLLTVIIVRELLKLLPNSFYTSMLPGWHFTFHSNEWILTICSVIVLLIAILAISIFKFVKKN